jgi:hypothetical protein
MEIADPSPNWRSPDDYAHLNELTAPELAWEFLRRNPEYIRDNRSTAASKYLRDPSFGTEIVSSIPIR